MEMALHTAVCSPSIEGDLLPQHWPGGRSLLPQNWGSGGRSGAGWGADVGLVADLRSATSSFCRLGMDPIRERELGHGVAVAG